MRWQRATPRAPSGAHPLNHLLDRAALDKVDRLARVRADIIWRPAANNHLQPPEDAQPSLIAIVAKRPLHVPDALPKAVLEPVRTVWSVVEVLSDPHATAHRLSPSAVCPPLACSL